MRKFLILLLILSTVLSNFNIVLADEASVTVHYQRNDANYDDWEIWGWAEGKDGQNFNFNEFDSFGAVANINVADANKVGFIIKKSDWTKDFDGDRFIDLSLGNEIWVVSGEENFLYEAPEGYDTEKENKNFKLSLVYDKYDDDYSNVTFDYYEKDNKENRGSINILDNQPINIEINASNNIHFSIIEDGVEYQKSIIFINKAEDGGELPIYLMQGLDKVQYKTTDEVNMQNFIYSAIITDVDEITITLARPIEYNNDFEVFSVDGIKVFGTNAIPKSSSYSKLELNYANEFKLQTEDLDLNKSYIVKENVYNTECETQLGNVYDTEKFVNLFTYNGDDLGATYSKDETSFRVWAPTAKQLNLYTYEKHEKTNNIPDEVIPMEKSINGTWTVTLLGDKDGLMYNYGVEFANESEVAIDPYAKAVTINGNKGVVLNPENTEIKNKVKLKSIAEPIDSIIYEIHIRDLSMDDSSGIQNKGKFLGFTERGTTTPDGVATGLDHILDLGITHLHILPSFDYATVDENKTNEFNWGYDPKNYNVPEGSYSTEPSNPTNRILEFKEMINTLHDNDIRVVMDVVYNHMYSSTSSGFEKLVPGYYFRMDGNTFTNGSGCGNETASERPMMRKYIIDSLKYWTTEYSVDGFRFDLMALHDIETMNMVIDELEKINPDILVYGEGWDAGGSPLNTKIKALKQNASYVNSNIAFFSDDIRDGIKGSVFNDEEKGFVSGSTSKIEDVKFGIVGAVDHPQVNINKVDYSDKPWAKHPTQSINYASAHDNLTLYDKLLASTNASDEVIINMNKMSAAIVLTSQGIPFFQAGEELARTKDGDHNSYKSSDRINSIKWDTKSERMDLFNYYKGLIELRKETEAFRYSTKGEVVENLKFLNTDKNVIAYTVNGTKNDKYEKYLVAFNPNDTPYTINFEKSKYDVLVNKDFAGAKSIETIKSSDITVDANGTIVIGLINNEDLFTKLDLFLFTLLLCLIAFLAYRKKQKRS